MKYVNLLGVIIFLSSGYIYACEKTLRDFGAVGNGVANDSAAVQSALNDGCDINGEGYRYKVNGSMQINKNITLRNAYFIQNAVNEEIKTLYVKDSTVHFKNITVDRGSDQRNGHAERSAGIYLENSNDSVLEHLNVTGDGYGSGIYVLDSNNVTLNNVVVHDMFWSAPTVPQHEVAFGIRIQRSDGANILFSKVENIYGEMGANVYETYQSDGITVQGSHGVFILGVTVQNTGEGIDFTGSVGNTAFEVAHTAVLNSDSFGFKFANSAEGGIVRDSVAIGSGWAGFVFSGPSESGLQHRTENISVNNCQALNIGRHNSRWSNESTSGFFIMQGSYDLAFPKNIHISNSLASTSSNGMKFGFLSQNPNNTVSNVDSIGHTVEGARGF